MTKRKILAHFIFIKWVGDVCDKQMLYYDKSVDRYEDYQQEHTKNKNEYSPRL
ncbi:hypothetical protein [Lactococcus cremoris]|uniref:hypothetical protein n=1 Tax=Lactococcus lactis subsp. cremoris TaxID=1359 RepID=UPI002FCA6E9A